MKDAPENVEVPHDCVGQIIGRGGATMQRLMESTGCKIEIPKKDERKEEGTNGVLVTLEGTPAQRRLAAAAIADVLEQAKSDNGSGGDAVEDHAARAEGALVLAHGLDDAFRRRDWLGWRLVPVEFEFGVRADMGRRSVRIWARKGRNLEAGGTRKAVEAVLAEARRLAELTVSCPIPAGPDGTPADEHPLEAVNYDAAMYPLVEQYGVRVFVPRVPEDGRMPIRVTGLEGPATVAAQLLEAGYVKNKCTASILQNGQIQSMSMSMGKEFAGDVRSLEAEYQVKVCQSPNLIWLQAPSKNAAKLAITTLTEMLQFYMPDQFSLLTGIGATAVERLQTDDEFRWLRVQPSAAAVFSRKAGSAWLCGKPAQLAAMRTRVEQVIGQWSAEHWEMSLEDFDGVVGSGYGAAMWLLGPKGTGEYIGRISAESGARCSACPNMQKVWCDGQPWNVQEAKRLILEGMEGLKRKRKDNPGYKPPGEAREESVRPRIEYAD